MKISNPTVLKEFLNTYDLKAKKHSSQNFLIDGNIIRKIVSTAEIKQCDVVLEIGPGPGALTQELLSTGAQVIAVEKDKDLALALHRLQTPDNRLVVLEMDILEFSFDDFFSKLLDGNKKIKVVANLPYHITTPIISFLLPKNHIIDSMTLMVQKEVAHRFVAKKGSKDYSSFTIFIEHFANPKYSFTVEPTCFYPRPSVKSAVVHFKLVEMPKIDNEEDLFKLIRLAFSKRRKMLKSSLKEIYKSEEVENALSSLGINPQARPEELSRDEFVKLFQALSSISSS